MKIKVSGAYFFVYVGVYVGKTHEGIENPIKEYISNVYPLKFISVLLQRIINHKRSEAPENKQENI